MNHCLMAAAEQPVGFLNKQRPQPLAPSHQAIIHRLKNRFLKALLFRCKDCQNLFNIFCPFLQFPFKIHLFIPLR